MVLFFIENDVFNLKHFSFCTSNYGIYLNTISPKKKSYGIYLDTELSSFYVFFMFFIDISLHFRYPLKKLMVSFKKLFKIGYLRYAMDAINGDQHVF